VGGNERASRLAGINVVRVKLFTYLASSLCAAIVGLVIASQLEAAHPATGESFELNAIAAVVLGGTSLMGGRGSISGSLIGACVIGVLSDGLVTLGSVRILADGDQRNGHCSGGYYRSTTVARTSEISSAASGQDTGRGCLMIGNGQRFGMLLFMSVLGICGCYRENTSKRLIVILMPSQDNPFFKAEADAAAARALALGYRVRVAAHDDDAFRQDNLIDAAIASNAAAIILDNAGADSSIAAVRRATRAGIACFDRPRNQHRRHRQSPDHR
jgi:Branched-chain amino acid transport system / permease component/Periplasmic binding protein domain